MPSFSFNEISPVFGLPWLVLGFAVIQFIVILILSFAVYKDAVRLANSKQGLFLGEPLLWFAVVLCSGGYLATLAYWMIHYSSLRSRHEEKQG